MLTDSIIQWNPIRHFGEEIEIDDLLQFPLETHETLLQDSKGRIHRIKAPNKHSSLMAKFFFWLQRHLNKNTHLYAINNIITSVQKRILSASVIDAANMKQIKSQLQTLRSLKNDYGFTSLNIGDPEEVEQKLLQIEEQAYELFIEKMKGDAGNQEQKRRESFDIFCHHAKGKLYYLQQENIKNIYAMKTLMVATSDDLKKQFEERVCSIRFRISLCYNLFGQITKIEKENKGKFTILQFDERLKPFREGYMDAVNKLASEIELFVENIKINYFINPFQGEIAELLQSININPAEIKESWLNFKTLPSDLHKEISELLLE